MYNFRFLLKSVFYILIPCIIGKFTIVLCIETQILSTMPLKCVFTFALDMFALAICPSITKPFGGQRVEWCDIKLRTRAESAGGEDFVNYLKRRI